MISVSKVQNEGLCGARHFVSYSLISRVLGHFKPFHGLVPE